MREDKDSIGALVDARLKGELVELVKFLNDGKKKGIMGGFLEDGSKMIMAAKLAANPVFQKLSREHPELMESIDEYANEMHEEYGVDFPIWHKGLEDIPGVNSDLGVDFGSAGYSVAEDVLERCLEGDYEGARGILAKEYDPDEEVYESLEELIDLSEYVRGLEDGF